VEEYDRSPVAFRGLTTAFGMTLKEHENTDEATILMAIVVNMIAARSMKAKGDPKWGATNYAVNTMSTELLQWMIGSREQADKTVKDVEAAMLLFDEGMDPRNLAKSLLDTGLSLLLCRIAEVGNFEVYWN